MERRWLPPRVASAPGLSGSHAAVAGVGAALWLLSYYRPALMPVWAPWEFSPTVYLAAVLGLLWYFRGLAATPEAERPGIWRRVAFVAGVVGTYAVLQTRFEYWSLNMFFLNRVQHDVMHHLGPLLIAHAWPGETIGRGMPRGLRRALTSPPVVRVVCIVQQPFLAAFLFVGLIYLWLTPPVHFRAMIDPLLYSVMNWSMVVDGILFWCLVLDPRPKPPCRVSFAVRAAASIAVMFPQIALGAFIALSGHDLYPYYDLCGRLFPSISALNDQHIGGIVTWIPTSMMSVLGMLLVVNTYRLQETTEETDHDAAALAALAKTWTGR